MTRLAAIVADLARVVFLLRDQPEAKDEQKAAFRLLTSTLGSSGLVVRVEDNGLVADGALISTEIPWVEHLRDQMQSHGLAELALPADLPAGALLALLRALAGPAPGPQDLLEMIDVSGAIGIRLVPVEAEVAETPAPIEHFAFVGPSRRSVEEVVSDLESDPSGERVPELLRQLVYHANKAADAGDWGIVLRVASISVRCEAAGASQGSNHAGAYSAALRRMVTPSSLEQVAQSVGGSRKEEAMQVLQRFGAAATEVLLRLLAAAPTLKERRGYFSALTQMKEGSELVVQMLDHNEWYVLRNVAEVCGEMEIEEAVPRLARLVANPDERVRRAVAGALGKIGSAATVAPLREVLNDSSPPVRLQAIKGIEGRKSRRLASILAAHLDQETHPDVVRETLFALGRIGTPDAVQALAKAAQPSRRLFARKPLATRLAAVEGLSLAGAAGISALQRLLTDEEAEVREAAQRALAKPAQQ